MIYTFIKKLLFFIPLSIFFIVPAVIIYRSGENILVYNIIELQNDDNAILYGPAYKDPTILYKLQSTIQKKATVLALGSSRVMQFRSTFFPTNTSFYNAGGIITRTKYLRYIFQKIPDQSLPKVILLGLDQYWFNPRWQEDNNAHVVSQFNTIEPSVWNIGTFKKIWVDILKGKIPLINLLRVPKNRIGIESIVGDDGYLYDGSRQYGRPFVNTFDDYIKRINEDGSKFEYGYSLDPQALADVDSFLSECKLRNIRVIGFLPPYAPSIYVRMTLHSDKYSYLHLLPSALLSIFNIYQYRFFDFTNPSILQAEDQDFLDGLHGSDEIYKRIMLQITKNDTILDSYISKQ